MNLLIVLAALALAVSLGFATYHLDRWHRISIESRRLMSEFSRDYRP